MSAAHGSIGRVTRGAGSRVGGYGRVEQLAAEQDYRWEGFVGNEKAVSTLASFAGRSIPSPFS